MASVPKLIKYVACLYFLEKSSLNYTLCHRSQYDLTYYFTIVFLPNLLFLLFKLHPNWHIQVLHKYWAPQVPLVYQKLLDPIQTSLLFYASVIGGRYVRGIMSLNPFSFNQHHCFFLSLQTSLFHLLSFFPHFTSFISSPFFYFPIMFRSSTFIVLHRQWNHTFPIRTWTVYQVYSFNKYWGPSMCQTLLEGFCISVCETKISVSLKLIILGSLWFSWLFNWWSHHDKVRYFS